MIKVSDHAVVRYLERFEGFDVEAVRQTIASSLDSPTARELVEFSGGFALQDQRRRKDLLHPAKDRDDVRTQGVAGKAEEAMTEPPSTARTGTG